MSETAAEKLKEKGNQCLKDNNIDGAINHYTNAIEYDQYNPKLYSNRCTAYLLLKNYDKALTDAKKCVSLDPDWAKGYIQTGSCYAGLGNYNEAKYQYTIALSKSDDQAKVKKLIEDMDKKLSQNNLQFILFGDSSKVLSTLENAIRILLLVYTVMIMLPFKSALRPKRISTFTILYLCLLIIHIYKTYGKIQFNTDYLRRICRDDLMCYSIPFGIFRSTTGVLIPMFIILIHELPSLCLFIYDILFIKAPDFAKQLKQTYDTAMMKALGNDPTYLSRTPAEKQYFMNEIIGLTGASFEISLVPLAFFRLFSGLRNITSFIMILMYIGTRVDLSSYVSRTIQSYDMNINRLVYSPSCPLFIRNGYNAIRNFVIRQYHNFRGY